MKIRSGRRGARVVGLVAGVALVGGLAATAAPASAAGKPESEAARGVDVRAGAWIVTLKDGQSARGVSADHARTHGAQVEQVYEHALNGYAARMSEAAAARVAQDSRVAVIEPDRVVTLAAKPGGGTSAASTQTLPTGVDRIDADKSSVLAGNGSGDVNVDVAVIDTGIASHPDLRIHNGKNCTGGSAKNYGDGNGHGTHVAGTIAARDDSAGVVGVVPGARLWAVRVLNNQGSGFRSWIICGVDFVTANKGLIEVANMSLGGSGTEPPGTGCVTGDSYHDAICKSVAAGVTYVVAAGNSSADAAGYVPAAYDEVITVSALADSDGVPGGVGGPTCRNTADDSFADFSNHGADVDLIAPGVCIRSTWLSGGYNTISGTSMASPHVAGAAALYKVWNSSASPEAVKSGLRLAVQEKGPWVGDPDGTPDWLVRVGDL